MFSHATGLATQGAYVKFLIPLLTLFSLLFAHVTHANLLNIAPESVEAVAWSIVDPLSGQVIAEHNSHVQRAPASLTKMMVAYIALKEIQAGKLNKEEVITITPIIKMVNWDESQMHLKVGDQISVDQLLAGLIVMSANDAAVTLAEKISGSVPKFLERMNQEAQALGMQDTHFSNPAGITMEDHYSTAADLSLLATALVKETPDYLHYSKMPSFSYQQYMHEATNFALKMDPSADGLKTGYTHAAGYNLALTSLRDSFDPQIGKRRLIVVVLGTKSEVKRAEVAHKLMELAYAYTRDEQALPAERLIADLPVKQSLEHIFQVKTEQAAIVTTSLYDQTTPIYLNHFNLATKRLQYVDPMQKAQDIQPLTSTKIHMSVKLNQPVLTAPLAQRIHLATISIYQNDKLLQTVMVKNKVHLTETSLFEKIKLWFWELFSRFSSTPKHIAKIYPLDQV